MTRAGQEVFAALSAYDSRPVINTVYTWRTGQETGDDSSSKLIVTCNNLLYQLKVVRV